MKVTHEITTDGYHYKETNLIGQIYLKIPTLIAYLPDKINRNLFIIEQSLIP